MPISLVSAAAARSRAMGFTEDEKGLNGSQGEQGAAAPSPTVG
jgi:hypothetical protein